MRRLGILFSLLLAGAAFAQDPRALQVTCETFNIYQDAREFPNSDPEEICVAFGGRGCAMVDNLGQAICRIHNGSSCALISSLGGGICAAAGGGSCTIVDTVDEGLCRALGGSGCSLVQNIGEGLCRGLGGSGCSFVTTPAQIQAWLIRFRNACRQAQ